MGDILLSILTDQTVRDASAVESSVLQLTTTAGPWFN